MHSIELSKSYQEKLKIGLLYEDFCANVVWDLIKLPLTPMRTQFYQLRRGENAQGVEIKYQGKMEKYKSLYIETHEKRRPENKCFVESGVYRSDNTRLWLTGDFDILYLLPLKTLQMLSQDQRFRRVEHETSKAFILPIEVADKHCLKKFTGLRKRFSSLIPPDHLLISQEQQKKELDMSSNQGYDNKNLLHRRSA